MKKFIIFILFITNSSIGITQNYWFKIIDSPESQMPIGDIFIRNNYYYFGTIDMINNNYEEYYAKVCKVNLNGDDISSDYFRLDNINLIGSINILDNGNFIGFGHVYKPLENDKFSLWQIEFSPDFEIIEQQIDTFNMNYSYIMNSYKNFKGNFYFQAATRNIPFAPDPNRGYLAEISQSKIILRDSLYLSAVYDIAPKFNDNNQIVIASLGLDSAPDVAITQINIIDTNFCLFETPISYSYTDLYYYTSIHNSADFHYYLSGMSLTGGGNWINSFSTKKLDSSFDEQNSQFFDSIPFMFYTTDHNGITTYEESIYLGGSLEYKGMAYPVSNYFSLIKMDEQFNITWKRFYGGDKNYWLTSITSTEQGDILLLGRSSETGSPNEDVFIMKVDPNGLITSNNQEQTIPIKNAIITPNPGKDYLQLHTGIFQTTLQMFDINGKMILEENINSESTIIKTQSLSAGTYIWQLVKDGQVVENDKWVKE